MPSDSTQYQRHDYTISMTRASIYSVFTAGPFGLLAVLGYLLVWGIRQPLEQLAHGITGPQGSSWLNLLVFLLIFIGGIVLHELIHGITWSLAGRKPWSAIHFGFQWQTLTPYAHCREPLPVGVYRLGTFMPGLITGGLPALAGILLGHVWLLLIGVFFIFAAGGDGVILWLLRRVPDHALVEDHPTEAGCTVLLET